jgi:hypothetical protein
MRGAGSQGWRGGRSETHQIVQTMLKGFGFDHEGHGEKRLEEVIEPNVHLR